MPENFTSLLEALNTEGRTLARPAPAAVIETRARGRRRRRRLTAATSAVAVCAIAGGVALSAGGAKDNPTPVGPASSPPSASSSAKAAPHQAAESKNRVGADALLKPSEALQPAHFEWKVKRTQTAPTPSFSFSNCAFGPSQGSLKNHALGEDFADYSASNGMTGGTEYVFHYSSAAAAQQDYDQLRPDSSGCRSAHVTATVPGGFAWQDGSDEDSFHRMMVLSGTDLAFWDSIYQDNAPYDTSDDTAALQRMADRLDGGTPAPDPNTAPSGNTAPSANTTKSADPLPDSAWLSASQIPFSTADQSHGWVPMGGQQQQPASSVPAKNLCEAITDGEDFVSFQGATIFTRSYHGSPSTTPVYPGSNYLYSSADEHIVTFPGPVAAQAAYAWTHQITVAHGCQFKDSSGEQVTRSIKQGAVVGAAPGTAFSLLASDTPGPGYEHVYCVVKGSNVAWMMINFEKGDTAMAGDSAILEAMAARLP